MYYFNKMIQCELPKEDVLLEQNIMEFLELCGINKGLMLKE